MSRQHRSRPQPRCRYRCDFGGSTGYGPYAHHACLSSHSPVNTASILASEGASAAKMAGSLHNTTIALMVACKHLTARCTPEDAGDQTADVLMSEVAGEMSMRCLSVTPSHKRVCVCNDCSFALETARVSAGVNGVHRHARAANTTYDAHRDDGRVLTCVLSDIDDTLYQVGSGGTSALHSEGCEG